jgi:PAS domain S-box-containing protein
VKNIVCGGLDMTVRRRREFELEVERDFAGTLADTIPVLLTVVDEDGRIGEPGPNPAFEQILGWRPEEVVGHNLLELIHEPDEYLALMAIASAANGVPAAERESQWRCNDGSTRAIAWTARQILGLDGRTSVLVSGVDVTERKRQEKEVRASRQRIVEAADAARRRLERNLHDGAQQRLVALSLTLRLAESKLAGDPKSARAALEAARVEHQFVVFTEADHAFFNDTGARFNPAAMAEAYRRVLDWFDRFVAGHGDGRHAGRG